MFQAPYKVPPFATVGVDVGVGVGVGVGVDVGVDADVIVVGDVDGDGDGDVYDRSNYGTGSASIPRTSRG
jgi:hypothetical protein